MSTSNSSSMSSLHSADSAPTIARKLAREDGEGTGAPEHPAAPPAKATGSALDEGEGSATGSAQEQGLEEGTAPKFPRIALAQCTLDGGKARMAKPPPMPDALPLQLLVDCGEIVATPRSLAWASQPAVAEAEPAEPAQPAQAEPAQSGPAVAPERKTVEELRSYSSFYAVLGIARGAPRADVCAQFRAASRLYHPDKGGDAEAFRYVDFVYKVLSCREQRDLYDSMGHHSFMATHGGFFKPPPLAPPTKFTEWINLSAMREALDLLPLRTMRIGSLSWAEVAQGFIDKAEKDGSYGHFETRWREHERSVRLGLPGRLYNAATGFDGASAFGLPGVLLALFRLGMPVLNIDMVSSHYTGICELVESWGRGKDYPMVFAVTADRKAERVLAAGVPAFMLLPTGWLLAAAGCWGACLYAPAYWLLLAAAGCWGACLYALACCLAAGCCLRLSLRPTSHISRTTPQRRPSCRSPTFAPASQSGPRRCSACTMRSPRL